MMNSINTTVHTFCRIAFYVALILAACGMVSGSFAGEQKRTNDLGMNFIRIHPGTFQMGSPASEPGRQKDEVLRTVTIDRPFYLQESEVTLQQWQAVMGKRWIDPRRGDPDAPVTRVSYYDCLKFIKKLNRRGTGTYRLPTEAEWEYACRAGTETAYSFGQAIDCSKALYGNNSKKESMCIPFLQSKGIKPDGPGPVKQFPPNPWGIYDMHGNVWEWCSDTYDPNPNEREKGDFPFTTSGSKIRRGGSWFKSGSLLRSANRTYAHPGSKFSTTGFRLVLEAVE